MGEANIPARLDHVNWMLHMSLYVLCGGLGHSSASGEVGRWKQTDSSALDPASWRDCCGCKFGGIGDGGVIVWAKQDFFCTFDLSWSR